MGRNIPLYVLPDEAEAPGFGARAARRLRWRRDRWGTRVAALGLPPALLGQRYRRHVPAATAAAVQVVHAARIGARGLADRIGQGRPARRSRLVRVLVPRRAGARRGAHADPARRRGTAPGRRDGHGRLLARDPRRARAAASTCARSGTARSTPPWRGARLTSPAARGLDRRAGLRQLRPLVHRPSGQARACCATCGLLGDLVLPATRPAWLDASLARIGVAPAAELPRGAVMAADELVVVECDRFRPELLTRARDAAADPPATPGERVFVSRRAARGRGIHDEAALEPLLARHGFRAVEMEHLGWEAQVALMARTRVMLAPHGAGLANMLFCPPGTCVIEIADRAYPNPNFYAMAAALGHRYARVAADTAGQGHPLRRDLKVAAGDLEAILEAAL